MHCCLYRSVNKEGIRRGCGLSLPVVVGVDGLLGQGQAAAPTDGEHTDGEHNESITLPSGH